MTGIENPSLEKIRAALESFSDHETETPATPIHREQPLLELNVSSRSLQITADSLKNGILILT